MGTNYHFISPEQPLDLNLNEDRNGYHIGKRSFGWQFTFRAHPGVRTYSDWITLFETVPGSYVEDEYGRRYDVVRFTQDVVKPTKGLQTSNNQILVRRNWISMESLWTDEAGWEFQDFDFL